MFLLFVCHTKHLLQRQHAEAACVVLASGNLSDPYALPGGNQGLDQFGQVGTPPYTKRDDMRRQITYGLLHVCLHVCHDRFQWLRGYAFADSTLLHVLLWGLESLIRLLG